MAKQDRIDIRISEEEKLKLKEYCELHNIKLSDFIRESTLSAMKQKDIDGIYLQNNLFKK